LRVVYTHSCSLKFKTGGIYMTATAEQWMKRDMF